MLNRSCLWILSVWVFVLLSPFSFTSYSQPASDMVPSATTDPFFQPVEDSFFEQIPAAEVGVGESDIFSTPVAPDFFDQLPRALTQDGLEAPDFPEARWRLELEKQAPAAREEPWAKSQGYLQYRGFYSTNIDSSAAGYDGDLRRLDVPPAIAATETEITDWINGLDFGYNYEQELIPKQWKLALRYDYKQALYSHNPREDDMLHRVELASVHKINDNLEMEMFGGLEFDDREPGAQYLRPDYNQKHLGLEIRQTLSENQVVTYGYIYRFRDYEPVRGGIASPETPWKDWHEHRFYLDYRQDLSDSLFLQLGGMIEKRNHDSPALDATGFFPVGGFRNHYVYEPLLALTVTPTEHNSFSVYYRYRNLVDAGDFYDYVQNSYGVIYEQDLFPTACKDLVLRSELEYADRNYDEQVANPVEAIASGNLIPRNDDRLSLYLTLSKTFEEKITTGMDFCWTRNHSNDRDSRHDESRYGVYVRYLF